MSVAAIEQAGHRERLIAAMARSIEEKGYRETTVADVVRLARTSRRTFYEHFEDRGACFLALFEEVNEETMQHVATAVRADQPLEQQVDRALDAYLESVGAQPALYLSFVHELPGLGRAASDSALGVTERFARLLVALVESGRRAQPDLTARPLSIEMAIIITGGLRELMVVAIHQRRDLRELRESIASAVKALLGAAVLAG